METILIDCVRNSLRHLLYRNAIFMCERLCAEFPSETNSQLLAACYLQDNKAYSAYHILKGAQQAESRYLFATACFQMDLLNEAETALCPPSEPNVEVPNGAAGHYLLGLIYRYTDRRRSAVHHFNQALSADPLFWAAYEELCVLGAAEDGNATFGESASLYVQKKYSGHGLVSQSMTSSTENTNSVPVRNLSPHDPSPRQVKNLHSNTLKDNPGSHGTALSGGASGQPVNGSFANMSFYSTPSPVTSQISAAAPPPIYRNIQANGPNPNLLGSDGSPRSTINSTMHAPRRKFVDEGKLRKISGKLFDSGPRRSTRLAGESGHNTGSSVTSSTGNGTSYSSKYLGGSKLNSVAFRSVTFRKAQARGSESFDEGVQQESCDDSRPSMTTTSTSSLACDTKFLEEGILMATGGPIMSESQAITGASDLIALLAILGEGYRLLCMYVCQDALDVYRRLPQKHYNTGWVLSQVGKANFELVNYLEADRAFSQARLISPYSLAGMDIYSTVLFHLKEDMKLSYLAQELVSTDRLAPQSWCAMGNCYSLQKDHETALKNFQRAVQLNPRFVYAHTLCGHEYICSPRGF
ncbi:cell division cycle protein 27 homolog B-like isoform X2 [Apium graveolens]|uniref:cell division cycle protein 27 homolog B-like isoform X2 n=1 Tax=Apium graveolens TaxID=4045 RepID=UPI003D7BE723